MCLSSGLQIQSKGTVFTNIKSPVGTIWSYLFIARFKSYVIFSYKIYICVCIHVCPWKPGNGVPSSPIFFLRNPDLCSAYPLYELTGKQIQDTYVFSCSFEVLKKKKRVSWTTQVAILPTSHCLRLCHRLPQRSLGRWCFLLGTLSPWTKPEPSEEAEYVKRILCRRLLPSWVAPPLPRGREGSCFLAQAS